MAARMTTVTLGNRGWIQIGGKTVQVHQLGKYARRYIDVVYTKYIELVGKDCLVDTQNMNDLDVIREIANLHQILHHQFNLKHYPNGYIPDDRPF